MMSSPPPGVGSCVSAVGVRETCTHSSASASFGTMGLKHQPGLSKHLSYTEL